MHPFRAAVEAGDIDAEVIGYIYHPGGRQSGHFVLALILCVPAHSMPGFAVATGYCTALPSPST